MSPDQKLALVVFAVAIMLLVAGILALRWVLSIGQDAENVDREEDAQEAEERISTIKAALQDESTAHPHVPAKNYWSAPCARDHGGSAFPVQDCSKWQCHGLTMRDYFAAQAMTGCLPGPKVAIGPKEYAEWAYRMADAMLEARKS